MKKSRFTFGQDYLITKCRHGIAMTGGQQYHFVTDGYTSWLITAMDPINRSIDVAIWTNKPATTKARVKRR